MKRFLLLTCILPATLWSLPAQSAIGQDQKFTLSLELSAPTYNPRKPSGTISCIVHNKSDEDMILSTDYNGVRYVLFGLAKSHRAVSRLWCPNPKNQSAKQGVVKIVPGEKGKVFELLLAEILTPMTGKSRRWDWDWRYRFEPPPSPIHRWRKPGFEKSADFWMELNIGKEKVKSEKVTLKVADAR